MAEDNIPIKVGPTEIHLTPNSFDIKSSRMQMLVGTTLLVLCVLAIFFKTMSIGFLLDDFLHIDYLARAVNGDWQTFLNSLTGNWAQSDIMKSYRPIISLSLFADYVLFNIHSSGYHFVNLLLFAICAVLVSLITLEITGLSNNKFGASPAIWAGLLFVVYPLHPEVVCWIIGRGDLLCALFYLLSIFCYLRFRLTLELSYLFVSLFSFLISLLSKESAVTLPLVIAAAELLLYRKHSFINNNKTNAFIQRALYVSWFWVVLGTFASFRFLLLGTVIGGYGQNDASGITNAIHTFINKAALLKTLYPFNEEMHFAPWYGKALSIIYGAITLCFVSKINRAKFGIYLFLLFWIGISILPSFQIWAIYPNLVGSRLFFISSAPFCILLVLLCFPALESLPRKISKSISFAALFVMTALFVLWAFILQVNIEPWIIAGQQMRALRQEITRILKQVPQRQKTLLLNLPTDYLGAGMLTRPQYLNIMVNKPFTDENLSNKVVTIESPVLSNRDFVWAEQFKNLIADKSIANIFIWNSTEGKFIPWQTGSGDHEYNFYTNEVNYNQLTVEPKEALLSSADKWKVVSEHISCLTAFPRFVRVYPGKQAVTLYFPNVNIDPLYANFAQIHLLFQTTSGCHACYGDKMKIVWQTKDGKEYQASITNNYKDSFLVWLGRYRNWTLAQNITKLGIRLEAGEYFADLSGIALTNQNTLTPSVELIDSSNPEVNSSYLPINISSDDHNSVIKFNSTHIKDGHYSSMIITKAGNTFESNSESNLMAIYPTNGDPKVLYESKVPQIAGLVKLPDEVFKSPGLHQIRFMVSNRDAETLGLPSEPITIIINETRGENK